MSSTRHNLLKSAKKLLWERGFEATSPRDIQDDSGAGQGSFYHHFDSKLDLAAAALDEVSAEMRTYTAELFDPALPGIERIARFMEQVRDGLKGCRLGRLANETAITELRLRTPVDSYFAELERLLARALDDAQKAGALHKDVSPGDLATMLVAVVQGGFIVSRVRRDKNAINRATEAAMALLRGHAQRDVGAPEKNHTQ